jgi:two-component system response regulator FixJ
MPDIDGVELLRRLGVAGEMLPAIVVTGHGDVQMAVEAMKNGAMDFIEKPFSDDVLLDSIRHAVERVATAAENEDSQRRTRERLATLSERELQVLKGVVQGQPNKVIAYELGLSPRTVEVYRSGLMSKMQVKSLADLVRMIIGIDLDGLAGPTA